MVDGDEKSVQLPDPEELMEMDFDHVFEIMKPIWEARRKEIESEELDDSFFEVPYKPRDSDE